MIFASKNEKGVPAWQLVMTGEKTVTRRMWPLKVCDIRSVQPGRCKKGMCKIRVIDCQRHYDWLPKFGPNFWPAAAGTLDEEARLEGFETWAGIMDWFEEHRIDINQTYRIQFEVIKDGENNGKI